MINHIELEKWFVENPERREEFLEWKAKVEKEEAEENGLEIRSRPHQPGCRQCYHKQSVIIEEIGICSNCDFYNKSPGSVKEILKAEVEGMVPQLQRQLNELETSLQTEREVHQAALETSRAWHERQKAELKEQHARELAEAQELLTKLQQDNRDLLNDIHQYKQKITTHEQTITQLKNTEKTQKENLAKFQEKWDNQLTQEKSFLQREIQLIKEVLNV